MLSGSFKPGNGWQEVSLDKPVRGRYIAIEALDAINGGERAAIAEFYVVDDKGKRLVREPWTVVYADSEDMKGNRSADKMFDLQGIDILEHSQRLGIPHVVVIDLGAEHSVGAIQYLPRMEADVPGAIRNYRVFVSDKPFTIK